ncbi:MAG: lamin tail domain-containing protein [Bacteroidales bacterium]|nr:lamin tail domain-containing protein [Bacteroidales bacterium]
MRLILFFILLISAFRLNAQFTDDFSDGDFSSNPAWSGDDAQFKINTSNVLQLNSSGTDTSILVTQNQLVDNGQWEFYVKQSFNSSSNNYSRIYLVSNNQNLKGNLQGYFVQIGSTQDDITLNRQDGSAITILIAGPGGMTANSTNSFTIKVIHNLSGNWELYADPNAGAAYQLLGSATDQTYTTSAYFGVFCKYTSSNATKVYFDDFEVQTIVVDSFPPNALSVSVVSPNQLEINFDEPIDTITAQNISNYLINNNIGQPSMALTDNLVLSKIHLFLSTSLQQGINYLITVDNIKDLNGNIMNQTQLPFTFYTAQSGDVVFNEIMADPTPEVGLPDVEYLELFNNSAFPVSLKNWTLKIGTNVQTLPDSTLQPGGFILLCHQNNQSLMEPYGSVISFTSFSLVNTGTTLTLLNEKGGLIHFVNYSDSWYGQSSKAEGGWSLEQIDPDNHCLGASNWWASNAALGGTPGSKNSIDDDKTDMAAPQISRVAVLDSMTVQVVFSESLDSLGLLNPAAYQIYDNIGAPVAVAANFPYYNSAILSLDQPLMENVIYKLQIDDTITDCSGNILAVSTTVPFGIATIPNKNDLVINEILFDPKADGVDYVEIYNRSEKIIDLRGLRLANYDLASLDFENLSIITEENYPIFPGEYLTLTTAQEIVRNQYFCKNPLNFVEMEEFPSMTNTDGNVYLITPSQQVLDSIHYTDDMHFALLKNYDGVSLERINYNLTGIENWHSAAESVGFGTPTYQNSQFNSSTAPTAEFELSPEVFSPDNDGVDDVLFINYKLPQGAIISSLVIYDAQGRLIRKLKSNFMAESQGSIIWDGIDDSNQKVRIGIYILYIETLQIDGNVQKKKLMTTVSGRL